MGVDFHHKGDEPLSQLSQARRRVPPQGGDISRCESACANASAFCAKQAQRAENGGE
jgi:hypothetical protein